MNTTLKIENGMSCYEVLQIKISSLEELYKSMNKERERRSAAIEAMERTANNISVPRRDRSRLSVEIPIQKESLRNYDGQISRVYAELKGMRKSLDLIITISNYGGELTDSNRKQVESILNY